MRRPPRKTDRSSPPASNRGPAASKGQARGAQFHSNQDGSPQGGPRGGKGAPRDAARFQADRGHERENARGQAPAERPDGPRAPLPGGLWLHGLHAVSAALANPARRLRRLLVTADAAEALQARLPQPWRIQAELIERSRFNTFLPEDAVHQGVALLVEPLPAMSLDRALAHSEGPVLVLDQVTDPRNVGAILRSAAAFGAAAVLVQDRHAPPETGTLARAASGAVELVPMVREVNLARALDSLKKAGLWVVGLAGEAPVTLAQSGLKGRRVALVLGAEGEGMRRLTREHCDELVRLPIAPAMESLNVSAAAAVALYELARG